MSRCFNTTPVIRSGFILLCSLLTAAIATAQPSYNIQHFTTDNGLPQNSVNDVTVDKYGYCWLSTEMGLVRYDGKSFISFGADELEGIPRMRSISTDGQGNLFAEATGQYDIAIRQMNNNSAPLPYRVSRTKKWHTLIGQNIDSSVITNLHLPAEQYARFNATRIDLKQTGIMGIAPDEAYLKTKDTIYYIKSGSCKALTTVKPGWMACTLLDGLLICFYENNHIEVWEKQTKKDSYNTINGSLANEHSFKQGELQILWCETGSYVYCNKKVYQLHYNKNSISTTTVLNNLDIPSISCLYYIPKNNTYFIGSYIKGLYILQPSSFRYPVMPTGNTASQSFYSQSLLPDNSIFSDGVFFNQNGLSKKAGFNSLYCLASFTNGPTLYYENDQIFCSYNTITQQQKNILNLDSRLRVININPYDTNQLYFCTELGIGFLQNDRLISYQPFNDINITEMNMETPDTWRISTNTGIFWYDVKTQKKLRQILDSVPIRTSYKDGAGRLWIGSYGQGFYLLEGQQLYSLPMDNKAALKTVHAFIPEKDGSFWIPTNDGLFKVMQKELIDYAHGKNSNVYYYRITKTDGLQTNEFNGGCYPAYVRFSNGMLSLPSLEGLAWFYPDSTHINYPSNGIYINRITVNDSLINTSPATKLVLKPDFSKLVVSISSPYFGQPENQKLEYNIEGLSDKWSELPADGNLVLNQVRHGSYKIVIRRRKGNTSNAYEYASLSFEVKPHFYYTWWFYMLCLFTAILLAIGFARYRTRQLKQKAILLEKEVNLRTAELNKTIEELGISQDALQQSNQVKDTMIALVMHDLRSPIRFIHTVVEFLSKKSAKMDASTLKETVDELENATYSLNNFTDHFFAWINSQQKGFTVNKTTFLLTDLLEEIGKLYKEVARAGNNECIIEPTDIACHTDRNILYTIIRNLLDNATKNTRNGLIKLSAQANNQLITIILSDTGKGMDQEMIDSILNGLPKSQLGFKMIMDMLIKIDGSIAIESEKNKGTTVKIMLPQTMPPVTT